MSYDLDGIDDVYIDAPDIEITPSKARAVFKSEPKLAVTTLPPMPIGGVDLKREYDLVEDAGKLFDFSDSKLTAIQQAYIMAYATKGTKRKACEFASVPYNLVNRWLENKEFSTALENAVSVVADVLEGEALRRAMEGSDQLLWKMLQGARPEKYAPQMIKHIEGKLDVVHSWAELTDKASKEIEASYEAVDTEEVDKDE